MIMVFSFPQKQAMLVRQLEDEVVKCKTQASHTNPEVKAHMEALQVENDHLSREIAILRETVKVGHRAESTKDYSTMIRLQYSKGGSVYKGKLFIRQSEDFANIGKN